MKFRAGDLAGFGTKEWSRGLLRNPDDPRYFGHTVFTGGTMSDYVSEELDPIDPAKAKKAAPKQELKSESSKIAEEGVAIIAEQNGSGAKPEEGVDAKKPLFQFTGDENFEDSDDDVEVSFHTFSAQFGL